jgi:hypothetical protein
MVYWGNKLKGLILRGVLFLALASLLFVPIFQWETKAQQEHSIETRWQTWPHAVIRVCIVTQQNQSWWKPEYLDSALNGVAIWNNAIQQFSSNYTDFGDLSKVSLVPTVTTEPVAGFEIYMGWIPECELESTIGQTKLLVNGSCNIVNTTVCLAAKAPSGHVMTETDMQNIVVHELGHNFGLSHCNNPEDVMYMVVQYRKTVKPLSTLDLYAVARSFELLNNTQFDTSNSCTELTTLSLPPNIPYNFFPIAKEHIPAAEPQSVAEKLIEVSLSPESMILLSLGTVLVIVFVVIRSRKQKGGLG